MIPKPQRKKSPKALKKAREGFCVIQGCPRKPVACHIRGKGAGGPDEDWNLYSACEYHHALQHTIGFAEFVYRYPEMGVELFNKGWMFDGAKLRRAE